MAGNVVALPFDVYRVEAVGAARHHLPYRARRTVCTVAAATVLLGALASAASAAPSIRLNEDRLDRFKFHGRARVDPPSAGGTYDPVTAGFGIDLINDQGFVYRATLLPGDLVPKPNLFYEFRDRAALDGLGSRDGVYQLVARFRQYAGEWYFTVRILAYADLSLATEPSMTVVFNELGGSFAVSADWVPTRFGWRLPLSRF